MEVLFEPVDCEVLLSVHGHDGGTPIRASKDSGPLSGASQQALIGEWQSVGRMEEETGRQESQPLQVRHAAMEYCSGIGGLSPVPLGEEEETERGLLATENGEETTEQDQEISLTALVEEEETQTCLRAGTANRRRPHPTTSQFQILRPQLCRETRRRRGEARRELRQAAEEEGWLARTGR